MIRFLEHVFIALCSDILFIYILLCCYVYVDFSHQRNDLFSFIIFQIVEKSLIRF